jgi:hypothetical protein
VRRLLRSHPESKIEWVLLLVPKGAHGIHACGSHWGDQAGGNRSNRASAAAKVRGSKARTPYREEAIYEQDFLSCSFGGRPGRGPHQVLANLHERIARGKIEWVLEADLKNFFGSLSHEWMLRFVEH